LFTGHDGVWKTHLTAAIDMYREGYGKELTRLGLAEQTARVLLEDLPNVGHDSVVTEEVATFRFLIASMSWLDIISTVTAGSAPKLQLYHFRDLAASSQTKLENIMGCENPVMVQIGRISALHERRTQVLQQGQLDCSEFQQTATSITEEIQRGLTLSGLGNLDVCGPQHAAESTTIVTRMFSFMAFIYLHVVTFGFQELEFVEDTISAALGLLQSRFPASLLPAVVAPLYVIATTARQDDEQFFRTTFSSSPISSPALQHRAKILPVLEEIWNRRRTTPALTWLDILELTNDILLL
jgi:hypothetical protein